MSGVDKNAGVLGSDDGINDSGQVIDIGESLDAQDDVVERAIANSRSVFGVSNNWRSSMLGFESRKQKGSSSQAPEIDEIRTMSRFEAFVAEDGRPANCQQCDHC